jgi:hypothetical protein
MEIVTEPFIAQRICRVWRYEKRGEEGGQKKLKSALRNLRTFPFSIFCSSRFRHSGFC